MKGGFLPNNLVLHELDLYITDLIESRERANSTKQPFTYNPAYIKLNNFISRNKKNHKLDREELRRLLTRRRQIKVRLPNPEFVKYRYVRYADDWLIGVWGTRAMAEQLKVDIARFLANLKLTLSPEKTLITNARTERG
jgi:hypothetical protein